MISRILEELSYWIDNSKNRKIVEIKVEFNPDSVTVEFIEFTSDIPKIYILEEKYVLSVVNTSMRYKNAYLVTGVVDLLENHILFRKQDSMNKQVINIKLESKETQVHAYCVDGPNGIFAIFVHNNEVHLASGNNGSWSVVFSYHPNWHRLLTKAFIDSNLEVKKLARKLKGEDV